MLPRRRFERPSLLAGTTSASQIHTLGRRTSFTRLRMIRPSLRAERSNGESSMLQCLRLLVAVAMALLVDTSMADDVRRGHAPKVIIDTDFNTIAMTDRWRRWRLNCTPGRDRLARLDRGVRQPVAEPGRLGCPQGSGASGHREPSEGLCGRSLSAPARLQVVPVRADAGRPADRLRRRLRERAGGAGSSGSTARRFCHPHPASRDERGRLHHRCRAPVSARSDDSRDCAADQSGARDSQGPEHRSADQQDRDDGGPDLCPRQCVSRHRRIQLVVDPERHRSFCGPRSRTM